MNRRNLISLAAAIVAAVPLLASAQDAFPTKPIRILVGTAPGALADIASRLYAERMSTFLKQPVLVDNVAGAATLLASRQTAKANPDGYTLHVNANTLVTVPHVNNKAGYSLKDFTGVGELVRSPALLVVSAQAPFKTLGELVAAAKAQPGAISYASGGMGTTSHLPVELLAREAGVKLTHTPYKGVAAAVPDVTAGRVSMMMATSTSTGELIKSGALRPLAISSEKRSPAFPNVPTFKELGYPEASFEIWIGMVAPAGIPRAVKARLGEAMEAARKDPQLVAKLQAAGQEISNVRTPEQYDAVLRREDERFGKLIKEAGITAE
ncbi:MAG TPA: tripartite tricarboxylate transporter substrate binding protein [Ramlibacter sp.]|nr:tripartite tricarboxylate transporter substrate binding protein [Ramlibacter sp.]